MRVALRTDQAVWPECTARLSGTSFVGGPPCEPGARRAFDEDSSDSQARSGRIGPILAQVAPGSRGRYAAADAAQEAVTVKPQIFISYRRDDAAGYARAVYDELARQFGAERVFMDVDDIGAGHPFDEAIERAVGDAKVLLVMIGKRWLGERTGQPPRIAYEGDFVRREVAAGLARGLRVMPLLLDGATMPAEAQLPDPLRALARRNALSLANTSFAADLQRVVAALRETLGDPAPRPRQTTLRIALASVLLSAAGLAAYWYWRAPAAGDAPTAPVPAARPAVNGEWRADVTYDWPGARYEERFVFGGEAGELHGSASFLRVPRGLLEGTVEPDGLRFVTRTTEEAGSLREVVHRYRGRLEGDEIRFVMQTEGASSAHVPVEFVARRMSAPGR